MLVRVLRWPVLEAVLDGFVLVLVVVVWNFSTAAAGLVAAAGVAMVRAAVSLREPLRFRGRLSIEAVARRPYLQVRVSSDFADEVRLRVIKASNYREMEGISHPSYPWTLKWREDSGSPKQMWWGITPGVPELADLASIEGPPGEFRMYSAALPNGWRAISDGQDFASILVRVDGRKSGKSTERWITLDPATLLDGNS